MSSSKTTPYAKEGKEEALNQLCSEDKSMSIGSSHSLSKKNELNSDEEISDMEDNVVTQETVLRRPLPTYPPRVNRVTAEVRRKQTLGPRLGGFRVKHGIQVRAWFI